MKATHPYSLRPFSEDPALAADLRAIRDRNRYILDTDDSPAYRLAKWLQATVGSDPAAARQCRDWKLPMQKAETEGLNDLGGFLIPDELAQQIVSLRDSYGVIRRNATRWPLRFGGRADVPRRLTGATAAWTSEGQTLSESSNEYDTAGLTMKKLSVLIKMSTELEEDALAAWGAFVTEELAWTFAVREDEAAFNGAGESANGGINGIGNKLTGLAGAIAAASGRNAFGTLDAADIGALLGALPARAVPGAKLYVSTACYGNTIVRLASTGGGLVATVGPDGELVANFCGFPVELVPSLPSSTGSLASKLMMVAGDMRMGVALGERRQITVRRLAERFADTDQVAILATERIDINCHDIGDATTAGAIVGLYGTA
jgi:HK97 family phage major capsid protein